MSGEHARIARLRARLPAVDPARVALGPGDDAALLAPLAGQLVLTVDAVFEGRHFERPWAPLDVLGRRAVVAAVSDVAAMGGEPRACLFALGVPADLDDAAFEAFLDGAAAAAAAHGASVVGGNLAGASELSLTTTVLGEVTPPALRRAGGRPGDRLYVTAPPGAAGLGLALLLRGAPEDARTRPFLEAWRRPAAAVEAGRALRGVATAAIDVSDGLLQDLGHLCRESRVGARVECVRVPRAPGQDALARDLGLDPDAIACTSGEGYALLFALPPDVPPPVAAHEVGHLVDPEDGVRVFGPDGAEIAFAVGGFDHFTAPAR